MNDEQRQAQALRTGLDQELAAVQATAQARERLLQATATTGTPEIVSRPWHWRPVLALPLAGALVAAVIAAAVVIPSSLRSESEPIGPAGGGVPATSTARTEPTPVPAQSTAAPEATPTVAPAPTRSSARATAAPSSAAPRTEQPAPQTSLSFGVTPARPETGSRVVLTLSGVAPSSGAVTVQWGDGTPSDVSTGNCRRPSTRADEPDPLAHSYARAGEYDVIVVVDACGSTQRAGATIVVTNAPETSRS